MDLRMASKRQMVEMMVQDATQRQRATDINLREITNRHVQTQQQQQHRISMMQAQMGVIPQPTQSGRGDVRFFLNGSPQYVESAVEASLFAKK